MFALFYHPWIEDFTGRQLPGPGRTAATALLLLSYLVMASLPALEWSRRGIHSSFFSRGLEAYLVFLGVFLVGWGLARMLGSGVSLQSALGLLEGFPWFIPGAFALFLSFMFFSYLGTKAVPAGRRRGRST